MPVVMPGSTPGLSQPFLGRELELQQLGDLLGDPLVRLVTLTGPAGVGKTRLATEYVARHRHRTPVVVVDLSAVTEADLVDDVIGATLPVATDLAVSASARLWATYSGRRVLLVLDNLEQIPGVGDVVLPLLRDYDGLQVLATSITPARMLGEHVLRLGPFPSADEPTDDLSVALFRNRAVAADAGFVLDSATLPDVVAVCRALGGLPLAIELAAARAAVVPPRLMARQLAGRDLDRLVHQSGTAGVPGRHLSLTAALEWTTRMLTPSAVDVLTQVAVFEEPFSLSSAVAVVRPALEAPDLLDRLSELVDAQLLVLDASSDDEPRFGMIRLVRTFSLRRLQESGRGDDVRDAHALHWRTRCQNDPDVARRHWLDVETALDHTVLRGWTDEALRMAVAAAPALAALPGAESTLLPRLESLLEHQHSTDDALEARAIIWSALHTPTSEDDLQAYGVRTARRLRRSVELARASGDDAALLRALEVTVVSLSTTFDLEAALSAKDEGLALATRLGDERALARFEVFDAMAALQGRDLERALTIARQAYERAHRVGDDEAVARAALMLVRAPQGMLPPLDPPLPGLDDLLGRTDRPGRVALRLAVLTVMATRDLAAGDLDSALRAIDRQLVLAAACERTLPLGSLPSVLLLTQVMVAAGSWDDAVRVRESVARLEPLLPVLLPEQADRYLQSVADLRSRVPEPRYSELAAEVAGSSVAQANRLATAVVRARLVVAEPTAELAPVGVMGSPTLTPREEEVLRELARGGTNRDVAAALGVTPKTVMHHTMAIYRKLGVRGRGEATAWAYRHGVVARDAS